MDDTNTNPEIFDDISEIILSNQISEEVYANEDMQKNMDNLDEENAKLYWINSKTIGVSESWNQNMKETNSSTNSNDDFIPNIPESSDSGNFIPNIPESSDSGNFIPISKEAISKDIPQINIPKLVFIVPYRNREEHLDYFKNHMKTILEDLSTDTYSIYYIHQCDDRGFNRGAMKNIGFLMVKNKYPNDYKNITLVFNDVDSMPAKKNILDYHTLPGIVKHFYGYEHTLGGIVSINAYDFEKINGYPNFWAWGYEDNMMQQRVMGANYKIDRNTFFKIMDTNIIQLNNTVLREVNQGEFLRYANNTKEGIYSIANLKYTIDESSGFVNVSNFSTEYNPDLTKYKMHDLRNGPIPFDTKVGLMYSSRHKSRFHKKIGMIF
jgi:regulator of replication initiation timing